MIKKFVCFCFIVISIKNNAQFTQNLNTVVILPYNSNYLFSLGTGVSFNGGFLLKNNLELGLTATGILLSSFFKKHYSYSLGVKLKFYPFNKVKRLYFSAGASFVRQRFTVQYLNSIYLQMYDDFTLSSSIGYLKSFNKIERLFLNSELFIVKNITKNITYDVFGLKIGLTYRFKTK